MKLKNEYTIIHNGDTFTLYRIDKPVKAIAVNRVGAFLFEKACEKDISTTDMLNLVLQNYEISTVLALGEIDTFIKTMKENGIIE